MPFSLDSVLSVLEKYKWMKGTINNTTVYYPLDLTTIKTVEVTKEDKTTLLKTKNV